MNRPSRNARIGALAILAVFTLFYLGFVHHTDTTEMDVRFDYVNGTLTSGGAGWHITAPWVKVAKIDLRPMRVCIDSASPALNCRLVHFAPSEWKEFIAVQGFGYFWWANRISFNFGYANEYRGMRDLMRGYAYSTRPYPFVEVTDSK